MFLKIIQSDCLVVRRVGMKNLRVKSVGVAIFAVVIALSGRLLVFNFVNAISLS